MQQKNSHMIITLMGSIFMMFFVAGIFHTPNEKIYNRLASSFLGDTKNAISEHSRTPTTEKGFLFGGEVSQKK